MIPPEILLFDAERILNKLSIIEKAICDQDMFEYIDWFENTAANLRLYEAEIDNPILLLQANFFDSFALFLKCGKDHALASIEMDKKYS